MNQTKVEMQPAKLFERYISELEMQIRRLSYQTIERLNNLEIWTHTSLHFLDLALRSDHWKHRVAFRIIRKFSDTCFEYLLVESELPETSMMGGLLQEARMFRRNFYCSEERRRLYVWGNILNMCMRSWVEKLNKMNRIQRRAAIRKMLQTYRMFQVDSFWPAVYQFLIRECTGIEPNPKGYRQLVIAPDPEQSREPDIETGREPDTELGRDRVPESHSELGWERDSRSDRSPDCRSDRGPSQEQDPELTVEVLRTLCSSFTLQKRAFLIMPIGTMETVLSHCRQVGFDLWGLWRGIGEISTAFNPIADLITIQKTSSAITLIKYGFPYLSAQSIYIRQCTQLWIEGVRIRVSADGYNKLIGKPNRARMMLILTTFLAVAACMQKEKLLKDTVATLKCLMRSLPDPYVLPSEIEDELKHCFLPDSFTPIEDICRKYEELNIYSEDYTAHKPRKLKHLSRCVIRESIGANWRLPEGIYELAMPPSIIKYLLLES